VLTKRPVIAAKRASKALRSIYGLNKRFSAIKFLDSILLFAKHGYGPLLRGVLDFCDWHQV
jgi:hypothetical protein